MIMMMMMMKVDNDIFGAVENAADNDNPEEEVGCESLGRAFERTSGSGRISEEFAIFLEEFESAAI